MKKIAIALLAGSGALLAHSATAADIYTTGSAPIGITNLALNKSGSFAMSSGDVIERDHGE